jgi:hypothetical protein
MSDFTILYIANAHTFPTLFSSTAFGIVQFFARLGSIGAPLVAEMEGKTPMLIFTIVAGISSGLALCLEKPSKEKNKTF